jgi:hypothetical protein
MKSPHFSTSLSAILVLLAAAIVNSGFSSESLEQYEPVTLDVRLETNIPDDLKALPIPTPHAQVLVEVDAEGRVLDAMPIKASHFGLIASAVELVEQTTFNPARLDGKPLQGRAAVYVNFFDAQQRGWKSGAGVLPFGGSASDAVASRFYENAPTRFVYGESKVEELDQPLRLVASKLRIYESEPGVREKGSCLVEYYVGPDGGVHFPRIIKSDHDDISTSAFLTLEVTTFEPPKRNGNPTCVLVRQPFNFK